MKLFLGFFLISFAFLASACNNKTASAGDESLTYDSRNDLMGMSMKFVLSGAQLSVEYQTAAQAAPFSNSYTLKAGEAQKVLDYMKSIDFHGMVMPPPEQLRDAGENKLTGSYNGQTRTVNLSLSQTVPPELQQLRQHLFALATQYRPELKSEMGL